ncbi:hypothetical protein DUT91_16700 [Phyllobacterium salinisoli]|uniref:Uncharacterized protein n=1 Tax=Phyllobacterium salinisoli TaxID=1899321 RepID=A0A368JZF9_9HYPH|nr:hypothetical protein DUT91_16700 [Phyllobacterium salinisoli]
MPQITCTMAAFRSCASWHIHPDGAGIGGILHFLNVGEGYPDYQIFVLRISTFVLVTIFFFLILVTMAMFAAEADRRDRDRADRKSVEFAIRSLTFVFMLMLALSAYGILRGAGHSSLKACRNISKSSELHSR